MMAPFLDSTLYTTKTPKNQKSDYIIFQPMRARHKNKNCQNNGKQFY